MTATEELRRMLDERGVEYGTQGCETLIRLGGKQYRIWAYDDERLVMSIAYLTPAQAIAATLGSESPRTVYIVESYDSLTEGCYVEPTCYTSKEAAIRRAESQTYDDGDGVQYWAHWKELKVVGR